MKTSLDHLPAHKREQLAYIVKTIVDEVRPEKIILFGSFATGEWSEQRFIENHVLHEYISDYDLLVISGPGREPELYKIQAIVEKYFGFHTPVSVIVHDIDYVNTLLSEGQYFFSDIRREGILLYDAGTVPLAEKRELTPAESKSIAAAEFKRWHGLAAEFLEGVFFYTQREQFDMAAFMLHQVAEHSCHAVLLVFSGYKPHTNDLDKLLGYARRFSLELNTLFPQDTQEERALFELLQRAYIEARYRESYIIREEQLYRLIAKVQRLHTLAEKICREKIDSLDTPFE